MKAAVTDLRREQSRRPAGRTGVSVAAPLSPEATAFLATLARIVRRLSAGQAALSATQPEHGDR